MTNPEDERPKLGGIISKILLTSAVIVLPCIQWSFFGWLHIFFPLLTFYLLSKYGEHAGRRLLLTATAISFAVYLGLNSADVFVFSCALLFTGYVLYRSTEKHDSPALSGLKAFIVLAFSWSVILNMLSAGPELSAYGQLVKALDEGIVETLEYYRQNTNLALETQVMLEATLLQMREIIPIIMPAVLGSFVLFITWFTMVIGNKLILQTCGRISWVNYRYWILPDRLIWFAIGMGILVLLPIPMFRAVGINCLILLSIIYCFQGLAINVFFMNKWKVPLLLRSFIYVMIIFQSLGTILLLVAGIVDIWFDFRNVRVTLEDKSE